MSQGFIPTIEANRKRNLKNGRTYLQWFEAPDPLNSRVVGLVQHRVDCGCARSIQAVSQRPGETTYHSYFTVLEHQLVTRFAGTQRQPELP
jgi:hypothetical protein